MPLLILTGILALIFSLLGLLSWVLMRIFGRKGKARMVAKTTALLFLVTLPVLIFVLLPVLFSYLIANASTRPQDRELQKTPADCGSDFRTVQFTTSDGVLLEGWLLPGEEGHHPIILLHGLFRNRHEVLDRACMLNQAGYPALLVDLRSHGKSQGETITLGYDERLDVLAARDFLVRELEAKKVIVLGVSMGAVAALHAAPEMKETLAALILDSPFISLEETVSRHTRLFLQLPPFPFATVFVWNFARLGGFQAEQLDSQSALQSLKNVPIFFIYGDQDPRMPLEVAQSLFETVSHTRKELAFVQEAGHGRAFEVDREVYLENILNFLSRYKL